jgi:hypothetical protein
MNYQVDSAAVNGLGSRIEQQHLDDRRCQLKTSMLTFGSDFICGTDDRFQFLTRRFPMTFVDAS